jgi:hypothetical protein
MSDKDRFKSFEGPEGRFAVPERVCKIARSLLADDQRLFTAIEAIRSEVDLSPMEAYVMAMALRNEHRRSLVPKDVFLLTKEVGAR